MFGMLLVALLQVAPEAARGAANRPPQLLNSKSIFTPDDYPGGSLTRSEYGVVSTLLHVSPQGRVTSCEITESSGYSTLDKATCSVLKMRARFDPATDVHASPVAGDYRFATSWGVDGHWPSTAINLPLQVASVPQNYRSPLKALLMFDSTGHVFACEVTASSGSDAADRAACAYAKQQLVIDPPISAVSTSPATGVRYLTASIAAQEIDPPSAR